jgi:hypothetical protein
MEQEYGEGAGEDTVVEKTVFAVGNGGRYMWRTGENPDFKEILAKLSGILTKRRRVEVLWQSE